MHELEIAADRLLAEVAQDPEYPFRTERQMWRRHTGRGRGAERFREVRLPVMVAAPEATPEERLMAAVDAELLLEGAELTTEERCCLLLYTRYELPDEEIADLLGKHRNTVRKRRDDACGKLRRAAHGQAA